MGLLFDCHIAIAPWGSKARFRRAKVGLLRKGTTVCIAIFFSTNDKCRFPIKPDTIEILPAAIRLKELKKDLFIQKQSCNEQDCKLMMRHIKVLLRQDELRQKGKADKLESLISRIPSIDAFKDVAPSRLSARLVGDYPMEFASDTISDHVMYHDGNGFDCHADPPKASREKTTLKLDNIELQRIHIKKIHISAIPEKFWLNSSISQLILTECNLTSVPKQLEAFSKTLRHLDLSNNRIDKLPRTFCCKMNNLTSFNLSYNLIETLPIEIKFFRRLVDLNISDNHLRMLPSTFSDLRNLRNLNVANNKLSQLPAFRSEDVRLKTLDVSFNPLDGALHEFNTFEVYPSYDADLGYKESQLCSVTPMSKNKSPTLFEIAMLNIVRCDRLLKLASDESLPRTIVSTMQRDIFKCYRCRQMNILPAYNSTDILDYVEQVEELVTTGNYRRGMTFMKLLCRSCFDYMSS